MKALSDRCRDLRPCLCLFRDSTYHRPHDSARATLTIEFPSNPDDLLPLFLALISECVVCLAAFHGSAASLISSRPGAAVYQRLIVEISPFFRPWRLSRLIVPVPGELQCRASSLGYSDWFFLGRLQLPVVTTCNGSVLAGLPNSPDPASERHSPNFVSIWYR
jgi:hypothetical protein